MMKSWSGGFVDLDLIFKVTAGLKLPNLSPKVLVCTISHELVGRFQPDLHEYNIGTWWRADLILVTLTYFSRSVRDLNCQIWAKRCLCVQYLMNQLADFNQIWEASSLGMQAAPCSIPTSGTFFRGDLVMKTFLRPFSLFRWFKKSSCQLLGKECALSTGKLPRRLAQEQCG